MNNISVYHWIPIADNMLPEIQASLQHSASSRVIIEEQENRGGVVYEVDFDVYIIHGGIYPNGFICHRLSLPEISPHELTRTLDNLISQLKSFVASLIYNIIPLVVRNKLAVLQEGIVSFENFLGTDFNVDVEQSAKLFLNKCCVVTTILEKSQFSAMETGFNLPSVNLRVPPRSTSDCVLSNNEENTLLCYTARISSEDNQTFYEIIYRLSEIIGFHQCVMRLLLILKSMEKYVFPLRRELVNALPRAEERYIPFEQFKKYLTYIGIKLPVLLKVLNHADMALIGIKDLPSLWNISALVKSEKLQPTYLTSEINEGIKRLQPLYEEINEEIDNFNRHLSEWIEGKLKAESLEISERKLSASQASLELDRGGKNRANALKLLSIFLSANLGAILSDILSPLLLTIFSISVKPELLSLIKIIMMLIVTSFFWILIEWTIKKRDCYFRIVIPVDMKVSEANLERLMLRRNIKRFERVSNHRIYTWIETFNKDNKKEKFQITIDCVGEIVRDMTIETEHHNQRYNEDKIIKQALECIGIQK